MDDVLLEQGSLSRYGRSPGKGNGYPLQYSCLENSIDRGAWWATVHGVAKSWTRLSTQHALKPSSIAPQPVESREAPTNSTVSLSSQRHKKKLPEVTGTSRGNPGFSAVTRERPRECFKMC